MRAGRRHVDEAEQGRAQLRVRGASSIAARRAPGAGARRGRERRVDRAADALELRLHGRNHMLAHARAQSGPRPPSALRRRDRGRRSGSRPTRPARWRSSARASRPSGSRATTTRSSARGLEPGSVHEYEVRLDGERAGRRRLRLAAERDSAPIRKDEPLDICSAPAGWRPRTSRPTRCARTRTSRPRDRRPAHARRSACARAARALARPALPARRPGLRRRGLARGRARSSRPGAAPSEPPGERGARLRGVHVALPRELERAGDPLAALDRLDLDDLGRPRHERRLEHLRSLARGDARKPTGGTSASSAAIARYWIYQHLGNLSPERARRRRALQRGARQADDGGGAPRASSRARPTERPPAAAGASAATSARTRVVVIDSRAGRVLEEGRRSMVDEEEWDWIVEHADGRLRPPADRHHAALPALAAACTTLEAWSEAVCERRLGPARRARGRAAAPRSRLRPLGRLRRVLRSGCATCCGEVGRRRARRARRPRSSSSPATSTTPTCARSPSRAGAAARSAVYQAVCSPYRNPLDENERRVIRLGVSRPFAAVARRSPRARRRRGPGVRWRRWATAPASTTRWRRSDRRPRDRDAPREGRAGGRDSPRASSGCWLQAGLRPQLRRAGLFSTQRHGLESRTMLAALAASVALVLVGAAGAQAKVVKLTGPRPSRRPRRDPVPGEPRRGRRAAGEAPRRTAASCSRSPPASVTRGPTTGCSPTRAASSSARAHRSRSCAASWRCASAEAGRAAGSDPRAEGRLRPPAPGAARLRARSGGRQAHPQVARKHPKATRHLLRAVWNYCHGGRVIVLARLTNLSKELTYNSALLSADLQAERPGRPAGQQGRRRARQPGGAAGPAHPASPSSTDARQISG